jgi:hypothetical protein
LGLLNYYYWNNNIIWKIYKLEVRKIPFLVKSYFSREKGKEAERAKSKRTKVEGRESLELRDCRIYSGKGGLSSINGYYGIVCDG